MCHWLRDITLSSNGYNKYYYASLLLKSSHFSLPTQKRTEKFKSIVVHCKKSQKSLTSWKKGRIDWNKNMSIKNPKYKI